MRRAITASSERPGSAARRGWQANAPIDLYWKHSPLKDVAKVKTPTIFLVGEQDPRVPLPQSVEMYRALKFERRAPASVRDAARGPRLDRLRHRLFKLQIEMEWFEKDINSRAYTWERVPGDEKRVPGKATTTAQQAHWLKPEPDKTTAGRN